MFSADTSSLNAARIRMAKPDDNVLLPDIISKEPLGPVSSGRRQWLNIAKWTLFTSCWPLKSSVSLRKNIDEMKGSDNPNIRRVAGRRR